MNKKVNRMSSILIDSIRISGFRGISDIEMSLSQVTVLTGMNNTGKTTILKALQLALGNRSFLSVDDFHISREGVATEILIDLRIVSVNETMAIQEQFSDEWEGVFTTDSIRTEGSAFDYVPLRVSTIYDPLKSSFKVEQKILSTWEAEPDTSWKGISATDAKVDLTKTPFFYIEAQRDVIDDMKFKTSYLGRMLSDVAKAYDIEAVEELEEMIKRVNDKAVEKSDILTTIQLALEGINSAMDRQSSGVSISPFAKKIRDLNKGVSIQYGDEGNSFSMDYHGMGTRSWSSLLTFKAFVSHNDLLATKKKQLFYPIIAIEEPEAHLHPNAQKQLYAQLKQMPGQKIISTHSPYVAACAELSEIRGLYKKQNHIACGVIPDFDTDAKRKIRQKVINTRGELFFSKGLVLFEGETEEQALPIMAEKFFGRHPSELGIDFIGVGGYGQYLPFLQFAESLNVPWYIFSDGEKWPVSQLSKAVESIRKDKFTKIEDEQNVFIIKNNNNFETMLIAEEYIAEIEEALKTANGDVNCIVNYIKKNNHSVKKRNRTAKVCNTCKQNLFEDEVRKYDGVSGYKEALHDMMAACKTDFGPLIATALVSSGKPLPALITELFNKIKSDIAHE